jgi:hypothetical protein
MADLRSLSDQDFDLFLDGLTRETAPERVPDANELPAVALETQAALETANAQIRGQLSPDFLMEAGNRARGMRSDVFLDISKGAPAGTRFKLGLDQNQLNQFKLLSKIYGVENVDFSPEGRLIIRNQTGEGGERRDILVDPVGVDPGDFAEIGSQAIPMVVGGLAARFGLKAKSPVGKVALGTTAMAGATAATGGAQDVFVRWLQDNEIDFSEVARERAKQAVADEVLGFAMAGGSKVASKTLEGLAGTLGISTGRTGTQAAKEGLKAKTGVDYPLSPGQSSENKVLLRLESMIGERIGTAGSMDRIRKAQMDAENELRRVFLGLPRTLTDDELAAALPAADRVGQRGLQRLGTEALRLEGGVSKAVQAIEKTGTAEVQALGTVNLERPFSVTEVGRLARQRVVSDFESFKGKMGERYEEFLSKPEISERTVSGSSLAKAIKKAESQLTPAATRTKQVETGLTDDLGFPLTETKDVTEELSAFVTSKVKSFFSELKSLKGAKVSVNDLKQIRTSIDNAISEGVAIPGTDVKQLTTMRGIVSESIDDALKGMDDKSLFGQWEALNQDWKKGMERFDRTAIRPMLIKEGEKGSVGNTQIAESVIGNEAGALDRYNDFKSFFGASSNEFQALQAAARQSALLGALSETSGYVDGQILRARLRPEALRPEVAMELFGANKQELHRVGEVLAAAQGKIDVNDLIKLGQSKSFTASKVADLVKAESERAAAYNNKLIKAAARGSAGAETIKPSEFVRYATDMDPDDAMKVMGILVHQPGLIEDIRRIAIEDVWAKIKTGIQGHGLVSKTLVEKSLGNDLQQRTLSTIIGGDTINTLKDLAEVVGSREISATTFKGGGRLAGAADLSRLMLQGEIGSLKDIGTRYLLGFLYSGPLRKSVTNLATSNDRSRFLNAVIASTPFVEGVLDEFGPDAGLGIMGELRSLIEPMQKRSMQVQGQLPSQDLDLRSLSAEEFNQLIDRAAQ